MADRDALLAPEPESDSEALLAAESDSEALLALEREPDTTAQAHERRQVHRLLYTSHILSTWNSRLFEFGAYLFLASLYPSTLLPASVYALARAAAGAILSPWVGAYIDRNDRLQVVRLSIAGQRLPVMASCAVFAAMSYLPSFSTSTVGFSIALTVLSVVACFEKLAIVMNTIAVERDWVVVIAGRDEAQLSELNSRMRRIDLFCKLVAPLAVSLLDTLSLRIAVMATGSLSIVSWTIEYFAIARVYHAVPELQERNAFRNQHDQPRPQHTGASFLSSSLLTYFHSPAALPSLALSFLYLTTLSFNGQLMTYLLAPPLSVPVVLLSILRGLAACAELSATFFGPLLIKRIGALRAGSWFLNSQLICVAIAASTLWLPSTVPLSYHLLALLSSVILSRIGLWGFDLSAQQQIQDAVPESGRGAFSSVEAALQNSLEMISFTATIVWANPEDFRYPGMLSAGAVLMAALLYALFVRRRRGHLLHLEKALCGSEYWKSHFGKRSRMSMPGDELS